jgi:hypothetical protein
MVSNTPENLTLLYGLSDTVLPVALFVSNFAVTKLSLSVMGVVLL